MEFVIFAIEEEEAHLEAARMRRSLRDDSNPLEMECVQFVNNFRVSKEAFLFILETINEKLRTPVLSTSIPNIIKLVATLRFCAQGSYQLGVGNECRLGLAQSTTSIVLKEVFQAIEDTLCRTLINFPSTDAEMDESKLAFYRKYGFPSVVGCIDGTHIKIIAPRKELQHLYYNRKGYHSINAMVVCDHKMRIRYINAKYPGASHDSMVFRMSALSAKLEEETTRSRSKFWLLGDAGYRLKPYLMTPFRNPEEGSLESKYNTTHISTRCIIERTIGVFKSRFRCVLGARALHYSPEKATQIVNVCAALHNLCINYNVPEPLIEEEINDDENLIEPIIDDDEVQGRSEAEIIRRRIMLSLE